MRNLLLPLVLSTAIASAQNAAPVQNNVNSHVAPSTATKANDDAKAAARNANAPAPEGAPRVLDSVVAIVNGDVLLESDVEQEQRLEGLQLQPAGENTLVNAAQHLVTRTLIEQRMKAQGDPTKASDEQVTKTIADLRKQLPGCAPAHCETEAGWQKFLAARGLSAEEVNQSWRERLTILAYVDERFRAGIRVSHADIENYYQQQLVPQFTAKHQTAPPLKQLQTRIQEVLLQEQVTKQMDDWEQTLRQEGSVQILVPAYGPSSNGDRDEGTGL